MKCIVYHVVRGAKSPFPHSHLIDEQRKEPNDQMTAARIKISRKKYEYILRSAETS